MEGIDIDVMAYDDCSRNELYIVEVKSRLTPKAPPYGRNETANEERLARNNQPAFTRPPMFNHKAEKEGLLRLRQYPAPRDSARHGEA
jgi:hypothetical protein